VPGLRTLTSKGYSYRRGGPAGFDKLLHLTGTAQDDQLRGGFSHQQRSAIVSITYTKKGDCS